MKLIDYHTINYNIVYIILIYIYIYIYVYIYIIIIACVDQLAKASDTQAVGRSFEPRPDN